MAAACLLLCDEGLLAWFLCTLSSETVEMDKLSRHLCFDWEKWGDCSRRKDGWLGRWMVGWGDDPTSTQEGCRTGGWVSRWKSGWINGWMDGQMDAWRDGCMERWMDGWKPCRF